MQTHVKYFWIQQDAERAFVRSLPGLCNDVENDGNERERRYYARLHALRAPMADAINRHVRGAFYVKAACTSVADEIVHDQIETHLCNFPVLDHEPFNLLEGSYVANLTHHLLSGRRALCAGGAAAAARRVAAWASELEGVMARHASNTAFDELWREVSARYGCAGFRTDPNPRVGTRGGRPSA